MAHSPTSDHHNPHPQPPHPPPHPPHLNFHANSRHSTTHHKKPARPAFRRVNSASNTKQKRVSIDDKPHIDHSLDDDYQDLIMAATFPQFCTVCDKQISNPCHTILYCSERCRRKDTNKPMTESLGSTSPSLNGMPVEDDSIVPRKSPTLLSSHRFSYTSLASTAEYSDGEIDFVVPQFQSHSYQHHRQKDSDAAKYLRQFQSASFVASTATPRRLARRPKVESRGSSTSIASFAGTEPSLVNSDTSAANSTENSPGTSHVEMFTSSYGRPLPPRTNPAYAMSTSFSSKSLSSPFASMPPEKRISALSASLKRESQERAAAVMMSTSLPGFKAAPSIAIDVGAEKLPDIQTPTDATFEDSTDQALTTTPKLIERPVKSKSLFQFNHMQASPS